MRNLPSSIRSRVPTTSNCLCAERSVCIRAYAECLSGPSTQTREAWWANRNALSQVAPWAVYTEHTANGKFKNNPHPNTRERVLTCSISHRSHANAAAAYPAPWLRSLGGFEKHSEKDSNWIGLQIINIMHYAAFNTHPQWISKSQRLHCNWKKTKAPWIVREIFSFL